MRAKASGAPGSFHVRPLPFALLALLAGAGALAGASERPDAKMEWIGVSKDEKGFVGAASGRRFVPWGFNYDRDYRKRLLEEYWDRDWATVAEDFREMKALGATVVRIHLQFGRFMDAPDKPNSHSLHQLGRLLRLAETTGLHLDLTGLGCYRKRAVPSWYDALGDPERWAAQARFWEAVARRCAHSPAVFCYDLMNEPVVSGGRRRAGDWLAGELDGFSYVQFISSAPTSGPRVEVAQQWIATLTRAIRRNDSRHLITVGLLPNSQASDALNSGFFPGEIAPDLDFISVHLYPRSGKLAEDLKLLDGFRVGKPVVIEEIFPLACSAAELRAFIQQARAKAAGFLGFYWGQTPDQLRASATPGAVLTRQWLEIFQELDPEKTR